MKTVLLTTNFGHIKLELDEEKAPVTVENFLAYVREGFYNGTAFHRVIDGFMIQGGGFEANANGFKEKTTKAPIANEAKTCFLKNEPYTIAMARTSNPHSATAQFFINVKNNSFLNYPGQDGWGYAVFGKVVEGQDVVDKIKAVKTGRVGMHADVPFEPVVIEKAEVVEEQQDQAIVSSESSVEQSVLEKINFDNHEEIEKIKEEKIEIPVGSLAYLLDYFYQGGGEPDSRNERLKKALNIIKPK